MRTTLATLVIFLGACSGISSSGLSNGGNPKPHDAGGGTTTTGGAAPGAPCASNTVCNSEICGLAGSGHCCSAACSTTDPTCAASGCDDAGACEYAPAGTGCGPASCTGRLESQVQCDGYGHCSAQGLAFCPSNLDCDDAGTGCIAACTSTAECYTGFSCNAGVCLTSQPVGACTENDDCDSGYCGVKGTGHCCAGPCATQVPCGATDCDPDTGACDYADSGTACGEAICDAGIFQPAPLCDGLGSCPVTQIVECVPYACSAEVCEASCASDSDCAGGYCDPPSATCCPLAGGDTLTVDYLLGSDLTACCGTSGNGPCQTLAHATHLIDRARARDVVIDLFQPDKVWDPPGEVYPIVLGWGAELMAGGTAFDDGDGGNPAVLEIGPASSNDHVGYASIVDATIGGLQPRDPSAVLVAPGSTLYLAKTLVRSSAAYRTSAIEVSAGAGLVLGRDHAGKLTGTVTVGTALAQLGNSQYLGWNGITCDSANGLGCHITDARQDAGGGSLAIFMQSMWDIDAEDFAVISLTASPRIGPNYDLGASDCTLAYSSGGILLRGKALVEYDGTVQCAASAFELEASDGGVPSLTLNNARILTNVIGVHASAGTATVTNSSINANGIGVEQDTDGTNIGSIDLSGGDAGAYNFALCNRASASGDIGVSVLNKTTQALNASNVTWDTPGPDVFSCDGSLANCTCQIASCTLDAGANGMDAVYESTGPIETTGNKFDGGCQ